MQAVLKKQIDEMTDDTLKNIFYRDYMRRLTRYRITDNFYKKKYDMDFERFEKENIVEKQGYAFEVESVAQEWELTIDGIRTIERKLKEFSSEN